MGNERNYEQVGNYTPPDEKGNGEKIEREFYGQGMIFKSDEAFYDTEHPGRACYVPELFDIVYTRNKILELCGNQEDLATDVYDMLDWQRPETLLDELYRNGEVDVCHECKKPFMCYQKTRCPHCGTAYAGEGN